MKWIDFYTEITKECSFNTDPSEIFYYAEQDHLDTNLLARNLIEIDIASAFPTLCKFIFGLEHPFVQKLFEFEDKLERNKFIAINLTHKDYNLNLKDLNAWCKFIILGYIYNNFYNVNIVEYKKDGAIFTGVYKYDESNSEFNNYIENEIGIEFHIDEVKSYIRFNRTSIFQYKEKISVKGKYKDPPIFIKESLNSILSQDLDLEFLNDIKKYYNDVFFEILKMGAVSQEMMYYYKFNNKYIQKNGDLSYEPSSPKNILIHFLYPIISMTRLEKTSIF
jgi:hypothetical protein